jgi:hypothetical protein
MIDRAFVDEVERRIKSGKLSPRNTASDLKLRSSALGNHATLAMVNSILARADAGPPLEEIERTLYANVACSPDVVVSAC